MPHTISLASLQEAILQALTLVRDEVQELLQANKKETSIEFATLSSLFIYQSERSQTVSLLASWGRVWDAEIILRSFCEASAKILLICFSDLGERGRLCNEFWAALGNINSRRGARRAAFAEQLFEADDLSRSVFSVLQDDQLHDLAQKYTKAERREIERRWSFSEIIERLSELSPKGKQIAHARSLLHMYDVASHLAHADNTALNLMRDRRLRQPDELLALEAAHTCRIWTDQFYLSWFCAYALAHCFAVAPIRASELEEAKNTIEKLAKPFKDAFDDSQREFYAAYRR